MARVYSALIFEGHNLGASTDVDLDPAYLWVVRDIDVFLPGPDADATVSVVASFVGATFFSAAVDLIAEGGVWESWRGRQVFQPPVDGPTLTILTATALGGADCRISGYRLTLP